MDSKPDARARAPKKILVSLAAIVLFASFLGYVQIVSAQEEADVTQTLTDPVQTFFICWGVGSLGAFVYLFLLMMTDPSLSLLENKYLNISCMAVTFTLVGGIVAAVVHISMGVGIIVNNVQNVFMLGFGWQGVMSGAGGSSKIGELKAEDPEKKKLKSELMDRGE